ncbi:MAG: mechanosensitive ion channel [Deltaproteobacteria bacterium]|jgi:small conductance mechanosensitive channel|nr:mechanosensitive ion channel [Deltaproteobacteria bacterium]
MDRLSFLRPYWVVCVAFALAIAAMSDARGATDSPLVAEAQELLAEIDRLAAEYAKQQDRIESAAEDESRAVAAVQARDRLFEWMKAIEALVANVLRQREEDLDASAIIQRTRKLLWNLDRRIPSFIDEVVARTEELRRRHGEASPEEAEAIELRLRGLEDVLDEAVRFMASHIQHRDALELGSGRIREEGAIRLERRAGDLAARLELARAKLDELEALNEGIVGGEGRAAVLQAQEQVDQLAASLWTTCDVMDEFELPTAGYRQTLLLATGELTTDLLDTEVATGLVDDALNAARRWLERGGPLLIGQLAVFLGVLALFWILSRIVRAMVGRLVTSSGPQMSELARRIVVQTTSRLVLALGVFVALSQVGVNVTALIAGLGIVGFIVGFALQDTLGNFAAGAMILIYRPFDVGDVIEAAGVLGTVDHMNLVSTTFLTFDNQMLIVPNSRIWGDVIRNATALEQRRVDLAFPLTLDADVESAEALFETMCREHPSVLEDPPPAIRVQKVTGEGLLFVVRPWVRTEDYWPTYWELNREAHRRLASAGIRIAAARYELAVEGTVRPK